MTNVWGEPLFEVTQFLGITYGQDHEEYASEEAALDDHVRSAVPEQLEGLVKDVAFLRARHPDRRTWLGLLDVRLPFSPEEVAELLIQAETAATTELQRRACGA